MGKKINKNITTIHLFIIVFVAILEVILITRGKYVYGSFGDWLLQSTPFYEYFRNLFYETGELFPDLALHIGGGQNIYYFVYYGLYSPYLFIFYLLPFVKAGDYLVITSIFNMIISSIMSYFFFKKNSYNASISLFGSLLLLVSTSMFFFSFNLIMFVQYMPFLILGLFGTKRFIDKNKSSLLIISIILIITTSYYFSIPSIMCLCIYALYYYIKIHNNIRFKMIFNVGIKYIFRVMLGILISAFVLLPVIFIILNGRNINVSILDISNLAWGVNVGYLMYDSLGLGLSSIVWLSLIYNILYLNKENKIISLILLIIIGMPLIDIMLNGFLYQCGKVFIPFIPLFIVLILEMLNTIKHDRNKKIYFTLFCSLLLSLVILKFDNTVYIYFFYLDLFISYILLFLYKKKNIYIFIIIFFVIFVDIYYVKNKDTLIMSKERYDSVYNLFYNDGLKFINNNFDNIYRTDYDTYHKIINYSDATSLYTTTFYSSTYNNIYKDIYIDIFNNNFENTCMLIFQGHDNLFFKKFMGVKYILTNYNVPYGYKKVSEYNDVNLYQNDNVYSLGFVLDSLISYDDYNKLSFIEKLLAYQNNIIINSGGNNSDLDLYYEKVELDYNVKSMENIIINKDKDHYIIDSLYKGNLTLSLNKLLKNKTLVIRFNVNNDAATNRSIIINNIKNSLTHKNSKYYNNNKSFDYVISSNDIINELNIEFYKGIYDISDIEIYAVDNTFFDRNNATPLEIDFAKTKGDNIYGSINLKKAGYFIFTIPYDKGYTIYVDNKEVEIEKVSGGFIGFKIDEGYHDIHLTFEAPYARIGRIISLFGIVILIILNIYERKKD